MKLFCYTVCDDCTDTWWYGITSTRGSAFGAGKRLARKRELQNWTVTVHEVKP